jgi:predicted dehydrogenase
MHSKALRVAIVGLGFHGVALASRLIDSPARWSLVALVDPSIAALMRFRASRPEARVPFFRDVREAVALKPDAIFVTTPAPSHAEVAVAIIEAGFTGSLLIEKPVSNSVASAEWLVGRARAAGFRGRIGVDFHRRCSALYKTAHDRVRSGQFGALRGIQFSHRCKFANSGVHFVDLANWLVGSRPERVSATLEEHSLGDYRGSFFHDPPGVAEISYAGGLKFELDTRGQASSAGRLGLRVELERAELFIDDKESFLQLESSSGVEKVVSDKSAFGYNWIEATLLALLDPSTGFSPCTLEESLDSLEVVVAAHISHERGGKSVSLPLGADEKRKALRVT